MTVTVMQVRIPAMSSVGYGVGTDDEGNVVHFVGDHRPMRHLGEAIAARTEGDEPVLVALEDWQVMSRGEAAS